MNIGIDNKPFEIVMSDKFYVRQDCLYDSYDSKLQVLEQPKEKKLAKLLYYLSLGFYDRRGWIYKVKLLTNGK